MTSRGGDEMAENNLRSVNILPGSTAVSNIQERKSINQYDLSNASTTYKVEENRKPFDTSALSGDDGESDIEAANVTSPITEKHSSAGSDEEINLFWLQHDQWQTQVLMKEFYATVSDPVVAPRSLLNPKPPTLFKVTSSFHCQSGHVRRRFSDFIWLRELLTNRYIGMIIPQTPKKSMVISEKVIQLRVRGLSDFLNKLLRSPYLRTDMSVIKFFSMEDESHWLEYKKSQSSDCYELKDGKPNVNEGFSRWTLALQAYRLPSNEQNILSKVRSNIGVLESILQRLVSESEKVVDAAENFTKTMQGFCGLLRTEGYISKDAQVLEMASDPIKDVLEGLGDVFAQWGSVQQNNFGVLDSFLYRAFKHELNTVKELQRMFYHREILISTITKNSEYMSGLESEKQALEYAGKTGKVSRVCDKILQVNEIIRQASRELELITKGMFLTEIDLFVQEKVKVFEHLGLELSKASLDQLDALANVWRKSMSQFSLSRQPVDHDRDLTYIESYSSEL